MATPRETKEAKSLRLIGEQRVRFTHLGAASCVALVRGESGDYVTRLAGKWECTCAHGSNSSRLCSHILAARTIYRAVVSALGGQHGTQ